MLNLACSCVTMQANVHNELMSFLCVIVQEVNRCKNMSNINNKNNHQIQNNNYLIWLFLYFGIGFAISFILPFPISLAVSLLVFLLLNAVRTDIALRRQGIDGIKGLYKSLTSFGNNNNNSNSGFGYTPTKFYCMNCGYEHREYTCHKCGSKAVKVG
jgi:hypothetical protein